MKKIKTIAERIFKDDKITGVSDDFLPEFEFIKDGNCLATVKYDGSCCAIINGIFYKRYDAKQGKPLPANAIKCQPDGDEITGHLPCWVPVDKNDPSDKWFIKALETSGFTEDGTYEAIGRHFNSNRYKLSIDTLLKHGADIIDPSDFELSVAGIRTYFQKLFDENQAIEGIVFWQDGKPIGKIKSSDFGIKWFEHCRSPKF